MLSKRWERAFLPHRLRAHFGFVGAAGTPAPVDAPWVPGDERVLVLAPHSDDEVLGPGGAAILHARAGGHLAAAIVNDGIGSGPDEMTDAELVRTREDEARAAGEIIGYVTHDFARLPDRSQDSWQRGRRWLRDVMNRERPELVYVPSPFDEHDDHLFTARLLAEELATDPGSVREIACYEVWTPLAPNRVVDISAAAEAKRRAIRCYSTQTERSNIEGALMGLGKFRAHRHLPGIADSAEAFLAAAPADFISLVRAI